MATLDFGTDLSTFAGDEGAVDLDPLLPPMSGERVALEGIARRWSTPRGSLGFAGLPDYGYDLMTLAAKRMSPLAIARAQAALAAEAAREQGVLGCSVSIVETSQNNYRVTASVRFASGPYTLVLSVDQLTIQLLRASRG
jgi:hypothetical protein